MPRKKKSNNKFKTQKRNKFRKSYKLKTSKKKIYNKLVGGSSLTNASTLELQAPTQLEQSYYKNFEIFENLIYSESYHNIVEENTLLTQVPIEKSKRRRVSMPLIGDKKGADILRRRASLPPFEASFYYLDKEDPLLEKMGETGDGGAEKNTDIILKLIQHCSKVSFLIYENTLNQTILEFYLALLRYNQFDLKDIVKVVADPANWEKELIILNSSLFNKHYQNAEIIFVHFYKLAKYSGIDTEQIMGSSNLSAEIKHSITEEEIKLKRAGVSSLFIEHFQHLNSSYTKDGIDKFFTLLRKLFSDGTTDYEEFDNNRSIILNIKYVLDNYEDALLEEQILRIIKELQSSLAPKDFRTFGAKQKAQLDYQLKSLNAFNRFRETIPLGNYVNQNLDDFENFLDELLQSNFHKPGILLLLNQLTKIYGSTERYAEPREKIFIVGLSVVDGEEGEVGVETGRIYNSAHSASLTGYDIISLNLKDLSIYIFEVVLQKILEDKQFNIDNLVNDVNNKFENSSEIVKYPHKYVQIRNIIGVCGEYLKAIKKKLDQIALAAAQ